MYVSHLSIPGTHGKWRWMVTKSFEGWNRWYIAITTPTHQWILFSKHNL
jgi:hypothetical protein